jgi:DNA-binding transcriptional ArsR family regulator/protein-L-isoaspartate O-methyltransferase
VSGKSALCLSVYSDIEISKTTPSRKTPLTTLDTTTALCRALGDQTRVRLLSLLSEDELTVAELTRITQLPQPRISTHLRKLRESGFVRDRREGGSSFYGLDKARWPPENGRILQAVFASTDDPLLSVDRRRAAEVISARGETWAESVAGMMARHYSPGRTWPALAHGLVGLTRLGRIIDIASGDSAAAELLSGQATSVICLDISEKVVATNQRRLSHLKNVRFVQGDMHAVPLPAATFDHALLLSSLSYTATPETVLTEAARLLVGGGRLSVVALHTHAHDDIIASYNQLNSGFSVEALSELAEATGFSIDRCEVSGRERRAPHFEYITLYAHRR